MTENDAFLGPFLKIWAEIKQPIRPSESELQFYENYVNKISELDNPKMLILGSTPEFRDMAIKYGMQSVCADLGKPIWEAMKHFMTEQGEDELLHCDWLKLPENNKYDLILLDDFEKVMRDYRSMNSEINLYGYTVLIANNIREAEYPHLTQVELFDQVLSKYLSKEEWDELRPFLAPLKIYIPTKNDLREMVDKHFEIEQVNEYDDVGYWDMAAQYVFKKKVY